eukprot:1083313-Rhodomonas_salina.2
MKAGRRAQIVAFYKVLRERCTANTTLVQSVALEGRRCKKIAKSCRKRNASAATRLHAAGILASFLRFWDHKIRPLARR